MIKREKRRYLALDLVGEQFFEERTILDSIQSSVRKLFGEYGASKANIKLIKFVPEKRRLVIRCSHKFLEQVRASIASIIEIKGKPVALHVVGVSGTLKSLHKKTELL